MDKEIINTINTLYYYYINNCNYVFTHIDDNVIILRKTDTTITNENRYNIINPSYAKYYGSNFKVEYIFNMWNPHISYKTKNLECSNIKNEKTTLVFTINKFIRNSTEEEEINENDIIMHEIYYLDYYVNINLVIYKILEKYIKSLNNYKGEIYSWNDNGELLLQHIYY